jgi:hypothetical protein
MFRAGLLLIITRVTTILYIHSNWYMLCVYLDWLLAGSGWSSILMMSSKPAYNM